MGKLSGFASRHRTGVAAGVVAVVGLLVFVLVWFQPQKLFLNTTVNESFPAQPPAADGVTPAAAVVASGSFRSLEHHTAGQIRILRLAGGSHVLRLVDLDTSNGPDLRVYLSRIPPDRGLHDYGKDYVQLGHLKGNKGNQNYAIPAGTDLSEYRSVVIWCARFAVGFGVAPVHRKAAET